MPPSEFSRELSEQSSPEQLQGSGIAAAAPAVVALPGLPGSAAGPSLSAWPSWGRPALLAAGGVVALDGLSHLIHPGAGLVLGLGVLAGGWWLLAPGARPLVRRQPSNLKGWIERCEALLVQFNKLEPGAGQAARRAELAELVGRRGQAGVGARRQAGAGLRGRSGLGVRTRAQARRGGW
jgi:hypothetical protein